MKEYHIEIIDDFIDMMILLHIDLKIDIENILFKGEMLGWSNDKQKHVSLDKSVYAEFENFDYVKFKDYYNNLLNRYLEYLKTTIDNKAKLNNFIALLEYPPIKYHTKLIEFFGNRLDEFVRDYLDIYPILDINTFEIKSKIIDGWYGDNIEVSCDIANSIYIEDNELGDRIINVDEFFRRIKLREKL